MSIITILILAAVLWAIFTYLIPKLPSPINTVATVIVVIIVIVYLLRLVGLY